MPEYFTFIDEPMVASKQGAGEATTLYEFYDEQLPSVQERSKTYAQMGLGDAIDYRGTKEQNIALLQELKNNPQQEILTFIDDPVSTVSNQLVNNGFLQALSKRESGGNPRSVNSLGYAGKYQFGEQALADIGLYNKSGRYNNDWSGTWNIEGVNSLQDFLNNESIQDEAQKQLVQKNWQYIKNLGLDKFIGRTVGGIPITASGLLAAAHLGGVGSVNKFLKNGTANKDAYGTSVADYLKTFSNYEVSSLLT